MREIPRTPEPLLVRTDFSNETAWRALVHEASQGYEDDFRANLHFVDDKSFDGTEPVDIASAAKSTGHPVLFVADGTTLSNAEHLVLCISLHGLGSFRVPPTSCGRSRITCRSPIWTSRNLRRRSIQMAYSADFLIRPDRESGAPAAKITRWGAGESPSPPADLL